MVANASPTERLLVTIPEACRLLSISRTHLYKLHRNGRLEIIKLGGAARLRYSDLVAFADGP
jgi:excisionase family DNA binding protein